MIYIPASPDHLCNLRKRRLLSQRALAQQAGVALSTVCLLEAGKTTPTFKVMRAICDVLRVEPTEIEEFRRAIGAEPINPY